MTKKFNKFPSYFAIFFIVAISTFFIWFPFLFKIPNWLGISISSSNFQYILKNYDGPLYIVAAKSLYNPSLINNLNLELSLSAKYFAAHLPLYPLLIRFFTPLFGFLKSMIFVNIFFTVILSLFFYFLLKNLHLSQKPLLLTIIFLFLPRFLVIRSIGAPESLFIFLILLSLYFFEKEKYFLAGIAGGLASATKTPGILLFVGYFLTIMEKYLKERKINWRWFNIVFIPIGLMLVFLWYEKQYGNFLVYFNQESFVPLVFPYSVFNFQKQWVGTAWLEEIVLYFFLYLLTVISLKKIRYRSFFYFSLVFFIATTFVQHRDISRYSLPLWPLACLAFAEFFTSKKFLLAFIIILPAIYLFAWNYLTFNILPISNWQPFL